MLTIKEICAHTGITRQTFQSWRRDYPKLLPTPVAVDKSAFLFDDTIVERIRFILDQRTAGKKTAEIEGFFMSYHEMAKGARTAELAARLEKIETAFKRDMYSYKLRIEKLFHDCQELMAENHASAFLAALPANGLACLNKPPAAEVLPPPPREISLPDTGPDDEAVSE